LNTFEEEILEGQVVLVDLQHPWQFADDAVEGGLVKGLRAAKVHKFIPPLVYGPCELPKADTAYPRNIDSPAPTLRELDGVAILPNHVILDGATRRVRPEAFMRNRLNHHGGLKIADDGTYRAKSKLANQQVRKSDDVLYYADTDHPNVYGHVLLEVMSSLWALDYVGSEVKIATSANITGIYLEMFSALGCPPDRLIKIDRPIMPRKILLPSKVIQRRRYIDPVARKVYDRIKRGLLPFATVEAAERIYISRSKVDGRKLINEPQVEKLFESLGFKIVHPQEMAISDQVKLFSTAKMIAGSGGSAMHNTLFSDPQSKVLILSSTGWLVVADSLICQNEAQLGYVFGKPEIMPHDTHRTQNDWIINIDDAREAISGHFGI
jgi:capsular polysaccharide biosynthesis protein